MGEEGPQQGLLRPFGRQRIGHCLRHSIEIVREIVGEVSVFRVGPHPLHRVEVGGIGWQPLHRYAVGMALEEPANRGTMHTPAVQDHNEPSQSAVQGQQKVSTSSVRILWRCRSNHRRRRWRWGDTLMAAMAESRSWRCQQRRTGGCVLYWAHKSHERRGQPDHSRRGPSLRRRAIPSLASAGRRSPCCRPPARSFLRAEGCHMTGSQLVAHAVGDYRRGEGESTGEGRG